MRDLLIRLDPPITGPGGFGTGFFSVSGATGSSVFTAIVAILFVMSVPAAPDAPGAVPAAPDAPGVPDAAFVFDFGAAGSSANDISSIFSFVNPPSMTNRSLKERYLL